MVECGFEAIKSAYEKANAYKDGGASASSDAGTNGTGKMIKAIAIIICITAVIWGTFAGIETDYWTNQSSFSFGTTLLYWAGGLVLGSMMLGFSEIINLLQAIRDK